MAAPSERRARCYGIAALILAMVNAWLVAGLLITFSRLDNPPTLAEGPAKVMIAFSLAILFGATFASLGSLAAIEHASAKGGQKNAAISGVQ